MRSLKKVSGKSMAFISHPNKVTTAPAPAVTHSATSAHINKGGNITPNPTPNRAEDERKKEEQRRAAEQVRSAARNFEVALYSALWLCVSFCHVLSRDEGAKARRGAREAASAGRTRAQASARRTPKGGGEGA